MCIRDRGWLESCGANYGALPAISAPAAGVKLCPFLNRCPVRVEGLCNRSMPPRGLILGGSEVLCHRSSAELQQAQQGASSRKIVEAYA